MKKITFLLLLITAIGYSQNDTNSISILGGITGKDSYGGLINYNNKFGKNNVEIGLNYSYFNEKSEIPVSFSIATIQAGYLRNILTTYNNSFIVSLGLGAFGGYEFLSKITDDTYTLQSKDGAVYGAYGALQVDTYLSNTISLYVRGQQNYYIQSTTGDASPFLALGLKFNL